MKRRSFGILLVPCLGAALLAAGWAFAAEVTSIDFRLDGGKTVLEITGDQPLEYTPTENSNDKQVVIDLKGASLATAAQRTLDTSSFESPVRLVSPYSVADGSRIVVQLSEMTSPAVTADGNVLRVEFPSGGSGASADGAGFAPAGGAAPEVAADAPAAGSEVAGGATPEGDLRDGANLAQFEKGIADGGNFKGKAITINVRDADVRDVLRLIGDASGFNLVVGADVQGRISLQLEDVPWDQVLNIVLKSLQLGAERNGNVLRVLTLSNLTTEKQVELQAKQAAQASSPKITRVLPLSYATPATLIATLAQFGSAQPSGEGSARTTGIAPQFAPDIRTNSIIVQGLPDDLERIQKLIEILDTQTPQVMIEAKIVEATERFGKNISGSIGAGGSRFGASFNGGSNLTDGLLGSIDLSSATGESGGGAIGISPSVSFLPGIQRINAQISIAESELIAKVISSPRLVVLNNEGANIQQAIPVRRPTSTVSDGVIITTTQQVNGQISLDVTPQVTNDEKVILQLAINRDVILDGDLIANRTFNTRVLVDSGSTLVIAGLYTFDRSEEHRGIPVLREIPILGALFGSSSDLNNRTELFVFISPRILNSAAAGLEG